MSLLWLLMFVWRQIICSHGCSLTMKESQCYAENNGGQSTEGTYFITSFTSYSDRERVCLRVCTCKYMWCFYVHTKTTFMFYQSYGVFCFVLCVCMCLVVVVFWFWFCIFLLNYIKGLCLYTFTVFSSN